MTENPPGSNPEQPAFEPKKFTTEAQEALRNEGYLIYTLTGQSIRTLKYSGEEITSIWETGGDIKDPLNGEVFRSFLESLGLVKPGYIPEGLTPRGIETFEKLTSRLSEVAIHSDPDKLILTETYEETLEQHIRAVYDYDKELSDRIKGTEAVIGDAPDWAELYFQHLYSTGFILTRSWPIRTATRIGRVFVAVLLPGAPFAILDPEGRPANSAKRLLIVNRLPHEKGNDLYAAVHMVIPAEE